MHPEKGGRRCRGPTCQPERVQRRPKQTRQNSVSSPNPAVSGAATGRRCGQNTARGREAGGPDEESDQREQGRHCRMQTTDRQLGEPFADRAPVSPIQASQTLGFHSATARRRIKGHRQAEKTAEYAPDEGRQHGACRPDRPRRARATCIAMGGKEPRARAFAKWLLRLPS
ncbi:hypothetical protein HPB51_018254 [Rhipicephalus microplus]|uniref:Uncharacterized protein n=1 Tax=Rhipicephalus microplus TaxID=6941 RepID=A0A9J6D667_RHIMP|nr:hypothetical protein HPB51_018254 [Rhipicephalus microplus]